jgi:hypothetical protein
MVQYAEELDPKYRHASVDIFLDSAFPAAASAPRRSGRSSSA